MTDQIMEETMHSPEEKFFGVRTTISRPSEQKPEDDGVEVEKESRAEPERQAASDDDELASYSEKVQKRINRMTWEKNEERRRREAAEKLRDEAVRFAQGQLSRSRQYEQIISQGEGYVLSNIKRGAEQAIKAAKMDYRKAYEEGDADTIMAAQDQLLAAQAEWYEAAKREQQYYWRAQQARQQPQWSAPPPPPQQPQQPVARPSPRAVTWAKENPWFMNPKHKDMTAAAYGIHERLVSDEGYHPESDEYFEQINTEMHKRFPEYFEKAGSRGSASTSRRATVVAPAGRNNGARSRKVKLKPSQQALCKKLGLTPEQYARAAYKEELNG